MAYKIPIVKDRPPGSERSNVQIGELIIYNDKFKIPLNYVLSFNIKIAKDGMIKAIDPKTKKYQTYIIDGEVFEAFFHSDTKYRKFLDSPVAKELHPPKELLKKKKK